LSSGRKFAQSVGIPIPRLTSPFSGKLNQGDWIVSAGAAYINEESRIKLLSKFSETNYGNEL